MILVFIAAGGAGLLLGLRYKWAWLAAVSGLTLLACVPFALFAEMGSLSVLLITFGLLATLQVGYLGGALVACAGRELRQPLADSELEGLYQPLSQSPSRELSFDGEMMRVLPIVTRGPFEKVNDLLYVRGIDAASRIAPRPRGTC